MDGVNLNTDYNVVVQSIQESFDSYHSKGGNGPLKYCHLCTLLLADGVTSVQAQICTDNAKLPEFSIHDKIRVQFINHVPSKTPPYTIKFYNVVDRGYANKRPTSGATSDNPMVSGTARDRALAHSVHLWQMKSCTDVEVIKSADLFYEYLTQPNKNESNG